MDGPSKGLWSWTSMMSDTSEGVQTRYPSTTLLSPFELAALGVGIGNTRPYRLYMVRFFNKIVTNYPSPTFATLGIGTSGPEGAKRAEGLLQSASPPLTSNAANISGWVLKGT